MSYFHCECCWCIIIELLMQHNLQYINMINKWHRTREPPKSYMHTFLIDINLMVVQHYQSEGNGQFFRPLNMVVLILKWKIKKTIIQYHLQNKISYIKLPYYVVWYSLFFNLNTIPQYKIQYLTHNFKWLETQLLWPRTTFIFQILIQFCNIIQKNTQNSKIS